MPREIIIRDTHRGLWYEDGKFIRLLEAGRYVVPRAINVGFYRTPKVEVVVLDIRERELTIKGQEILTADKVAIRVSIVVQFRVVDPAPPCTQWLNMKSGSTVMCSSLPADHVNRDRHDGFTPP